MGDLISQDALKTSDNLCFYTNEKCNQFPHFQLESMCKWDSGSNLDKMGFQIRGDKFILFWYLN